MARVALLLLFASLTLSVSAQRDCSFRVGKLKYGGGGDWYANPSSLPNLIRYVRENTRLAICPEAETVEASSSQLYLYPVLYMTGHGNVVFTDQEVQNLRTWMLAGGLLIADDNYGMQKYIRRELKRIFPEYSLEEVPLNHPVYNVHYPMPKGIPKVHVHDGLPAQGFGIFHEGRLVCYLTYEADLGDGWEDPAVHNDPEPIRQQALQMGTNLLLYVALRSANGL